MTCLKQFPTSSKMGTPHTYTCYVHVFHYCGKMHVNFTNSWGPAYANSGICCCLSQLCGGTPPFLRMIHPRTWQPTLVGGFWLPRKSQSGQWARTLGVQSGSPHSSLDFHFLLYMNSPEGPTLSGSYRTTESVYQIYQNRDCQTLSHKKRRNNHAPNMN